MTWLVPYVASVALTKGVALITLPLLTSHLTPAEFGRLDLVVSVIEVAGLILCFCAADLLFRFAGSTDIAESRRNAAAIAQAYDQFHISLTRPAFEELSAAGIVFSGWLDLERTHLGNPRGGTCYVKGYSGFNSEVAVLEWFRKQLPDGWSIVEPRTANGIRNLRSSAP